MNKAILIGRLTKEPECKTFPDGRMVASFVLAIDRTFTNKDGEKDTDFIPIVLWGKTAELVAKYTKKGHMLAVSGRIQTRNYVNSDGEKKYATEVIGEAIQFLTTKNWQGQSASDEDILESSEREDTDYPY